MPSHRTGFAPEIILYLPNNEATRALATDPVSIQFTQPIRKGAGVLTLYNESDFSPMLIDVQDPRVLVSGDTLSLQLSLTAGKRYFVVVPASAVLSLLGYRHRGLRVPVCVDGFMCTPSYWAFRTSGKLPLISRWSRTAGRL